MRADFIEQAADPEAGGADKERPEVTRLSREGPRTCVRSSRLDDSPTVYGGQPERVERALCYVQADGGIQRIEYESPGSGPTVMQVFERQGGRVIGSTTRQSEGVLRSTLRWDARGRPVELFVDNPDPDGHDVRSRFVWDERERVTDMFEAFADGAGAERHWTVRYGSTSRAGTRRSRSRRTS